MICPSITNELGFIQSVTDRAKSCLRTEAAITSWSEARVSRSACGW